MPPNVMRQHFFISEVETHHNDGIRDPVLEQIVFQSVSRNIGADLLEVMTVRLL